MSDNSAANHAWGIGARQPASRSHKLLEYMMDSAEQNEVTRYHTALKFALMIGVVIFLLTLRTKARAASQDPTLKL